MLRFFGTYLQMNAAQKQVLAKVIENMEMDDVLHLRQVGEAGQIAAGQLIPVLLEAYDTKIDVFGRYGTEIYIKDIGLLHNAHMFEERDELWNKLINETRPEPGYWMLKIYWTLQDIVKLCDLGLQDYAKKLAELQNYYFVGQIDRQIVDPGVIGQAQLELMVWIIAERLKYMEQEGIVFPDEEQRLNEIKQFLTQELHQLNVNTHN